MVKDRFVLAYHGEPKESYFEELDLVYRNFLLLDKKDQVLTIEGDLDQLEAFLVRYNLKSWILIQSHNTSPLLWSDSFPKKDMVSCSSCTSQFRSLWFDEDRTACYSCQPLDYKYEQAYPEAEQGTSPEVDLRKSSEVDTCAKCGEPTPWISTLFGVGVPTCSKVCTDTMWKGFIQS